MFLSAAVLLASLVTEEELAAGRLYPRLGRFREVSLAMAVHLAEEAYMTGAASTYPRPRDLEQHIRGQQYDYTYTAALPPTYPWASLDQ